MGQSRVLGLTWASATQIPGALVGFFLPFSTSERGPVKEIPTALGDTMTGERGLRAPPLRAGGYRGTVQGKREKGRFFVVPHAEKMGPSPTVPAASEDECVQPMAGDALALGKGERGRRPGAVGHIRE